MNAELCLKNRALDLEEARLDLDREYLAFEEQRHEDIMALEYARLGAQEAPTTDSSTAKPNRKGKLNKDFSEALEAKFEEIAIMLGEAGVGGTIHVEI